jgi:chromosome segregation protein
MPVKKIFLSITMFFLFHNSTSPAMQNDEQASSSLEESLFNDLMSASNNVIRLDGDLKRLTDEFNEIVEKLKIEGNDPEKYRLEQNKLEQEMNTLKLTIDELIKKINNHYKKKAKLEKNRKKEELNEKEIAKIDAEYRTINEKIDKSTQRLKLKQLRLPIIQNKIDSIKKKIQTISSLTLEKDRASWSIQNGKGYLSAANERLNQVVKKIEELNRSKKEQE